MSEIYLVPRRRYGEMEADGQIELEQDVLPLTANEECYLLRKRSGLTQEQVAEQIGVTRYWLNQIELGKAASDKLEAFWNEG
jgi:DNA-binding transcriptional regulator YiaG